MLLIHCPYCDEHRAETEFRQAGEAWMVRPSDPATFNDHEWADFLYFRGNEKGLQGERWRHIHGCGRFFNAVRHSVSDRILVTQKAGVAKPDFSALRIS